MTDIKDYIDPKDLELFNNAIQKAVEDGVPLEKIEKRLQSKHIINKAIHVTTAAMSDDIYQYILEHSEENRAYFQLENKNFEERLFNLWKEPFENFETMIYVSQEIGNEFNNEFRPLAVKNNDLVFEALIHLHGRACQIALEILKLMQGGFPDGAIARWRTLHEVAVICNFIQKNGNSTAERYLLHDAIESYKSVAKYIYRREIYEKHKQILGETLPTHEEMQRIQKIKERLCDQFGKGYADDWGWASYVIDSPDFSKIEDFVNMDHFRPYYKMANISIHAGSKGIKFHLTSPNTDLIPSGPGNMGMADPGQLAAISLLHVNTVLLISKPSLRRMADILALIKLNDMIKESFGQVHDQSMKTYQEEVRKNK